MNLLFLNIMNELGYQLIVEKCWDQVKSEKTDFTNVKDHIK